MPQVNSPGARSIEATPLPGARLGGIQVGQVEPSATAGSGGLAVGVATYRLGESILQDQQQIALQAKKQADTVAVMDAHNKLVLATQDILYNPEKGALTVTGKDALGLPDRVTDEYNKVAGELHAQLSNPEQQAKFSDLATHDYESTIGKVKEHSFSEYQKYSNETFAANQSLLVDAARINASNPQDVGDVLGQVEGSTTAFGRAHGWSNDKIEETIAATNSKVHSTVVEQLISNGDIAGAQKYLKAHKDEIQDPRTQKNLADQLNIGTTRMDSQNAAASILKAVGPDTTLTELWGEVDKMPNNTAQQAEVRDATKERVTAGFNTIRQAQTDADKKASADRKARVDQAVIDSANKIQNANVAGYADPVRLVESVVSPADLAQMTPSERDGLYTYAKRRMEPGGVKNDDTLFYKLMRSSTADPATVKDFINTDLTKYMGRLDSSHFDALVRLQTDLAKPGNDQSSQLLNDFRSAEGIINDTLAPISSTLSPKESEVLKATANENRQACDGRRHPGIRRWAGDQGDGQCSRDALRHQRH